MANSPDFIAYVQELMRGAGTVSARAMFGGHGIYLDGIIVAIVVADVLYLKTDAESRAAFVDRSCVPFEYEKKKEGKVEVTSYYQPPEEALESPAAMRDWLRLAQGAALRAAAKRAPSRRKRGR